MPKFPDSCPPASLRYETVSIEDFDLLCEIRTAAMRPSLEHLGRFDPARSRQRFLESFFPDHTRMIIRNHVPIGFFTVRPLQTVWRLDHLYVLPDHQSVGIGGIVLTQIIADAEAAGRPIELCALRSSPSNRFYQNHGFIVQNEEDWDVNYLRPTSAQE